MLTDTDIRRFLKRWLRLMIGGVLVLSLALNIFLLLPKPSGLPEIETEEVATSSTPGRWAFGVVRLPMPKTVQKAPGTGSVLPVSAYTVPDGMIPTLPDEMPLYRDAGVALDASLIEKVWEAMRIPLDWSGLTLHPTSLAWVSADGRYTLALDAVTRILKVRDTWPAEKPAPIDDTISIDLAKDFLTRFHILIPTQDTPTVSTNDGKTWVRWPKRWLGMPMIDTAGNVVQDLSVAIDRNSGKIYGADINLFTPETLTVSDYPSVTASELRPFFLSGGLLPLASEPQDDAETVSYTSMEKVYVLSFGTADQPTYVLPAIRAYWISKQTCEECSPILFSTFVPALGKEQFLWNE